MNNSTVLPIVRTLSCLGEWVSPDKDCVCLLMFWLSKGRDLHFDTCLLLAVGNGNISHMEQILKRLHSPRQLDSFEAQDDFLKSWCNKSLLLPWVLEKSVGLFFCFEILMLFSSQQWLKPEKQIRKQLKRKCNKLQEKLALGYRRFYSC